MEKRINIISAILLIPAIISFFITGISLLSVVLIGIVLIVFFSQFKKVPDDKTLPEEVQER